MVKKCIICDAAATHKIKDTSDYYCQECALEHFGDLSLLLSVEQEAKRLKLFLEQKMHEIELDTQALEDSVK